MPGREGREDQRTLGLSDDAHRKLTQLKDEGFFNEMRDAYRLAIAIAMAEGKIAPSEKARTHTYINVGSLDPDGILRDAVIEQYQGREGAPYEVVERLGEAGVLVLWDRLRRDPQFAGLLTIPGSAEGDS
jgi:hypothetical protein